MDKCHVKEVNIGSKDYRHGNSFSWCYKKEVVLEKADDHTESTLDLNTQHDHLMNSIKIAKKAL